MSFRITVLVKHGTSSRGIEIGQGLKWTVLNETRLIRNTHHDPQQRERLYFTCLMKISRRRLWPHGLYLRLNLSKRWNVELSACMSRVSTFKSYPVSRSDSNTSRSVRYLPSR